ncbi:MULTISPECIES: 2-hydroxyacid dehydrogenase [Halomonadaceae]|uniref:2-hydroxyacid dehydrogenase n=1 Tax=Halomonadaceae TaxID=28256 RepID=UPI00159A2DF9|nr:MULTISPECIES: 2-hydroxyacid dehydrogenase [Halomonas]QJQ95343.1 2-hydroxyacid dehydrogenase [Halomonas sp. PA5]
MKYKVLQLCPLSPKLDSELAESFTIYQWWDESNPEAFLKEHAASIDGIATAAPVGVPNDLVSALPNLQVISCRGVGMDKIDLENARQRGVQVSGSFGMLSDCVADMAFALLLDVAREVSAADRYVRGGKWLKDRYPLTTRVSGKRLGIVGLGEIGALVAKRAQGFDMEIGYSSRNPIKGSPYRFEARIEGLASWCDFLVVTVAGNPSTKNLISGSVLEALGPDGYLINVSRGFVVDQEALIKSLRNRRIRGAGLDVFTDEPHVPEALINVDNVVLSPHMASGTVETRRDMESLVLQNLKSFFTDGRVKTPAI